MHSSWMRTVCCSDCRGCGGMYPSMHWTGVYVSQHALGRGCVSQHAMGFSPGGVCPGTVSAWGMSAEGCVTRGWVGLPGGVFLGGVWPGGLSATIRRESIRVGPSS